MKLKKGARICLVPRAGPVNGPYTAQCGATFVEGLKLNGYDIDGINAVSGSGPTAVLGCIGRWQELCDIWFNLRPEEIVGDKKELENFVHFLKKFSKFGFNLLPRRSDIGDIRDAVSVIRRLKEGHVFSSWYLAMLIEKHCEKYLDKIFSSEAIPVKIGAIDYLTGRQVIFSNKIPEHKEHFLRGVVASMCIVPLFDSFTVDNPKGLKLLTETHSNFDAALLVDGGYRASLLLEEAIRDPVGFDAIFTIDINNFEYQPVDREMVERKYNLVSRIERVQALASVTNDRLQISLTDRIEEELEIRRILEELMAVSERPRDVQAVIDRMNNGRLRLHDKRPIQRKTISSPEQVFHFDFTNFTQAQMARIMRAGHNAALRVLAEMRLSTKGIPLVRPV